MLGNDNPFRYKGYYYDTETGLYYLNSRYYNLEWGRFISADSVLGKTGGLLSHNLFAYCGNNPVINSDPSGCDWQTDVYNAVQISDLGKDVVLGNISDLSFVRKEVYPGVYEATMRKTSIERGSWGTNASITTFTVVSGSYDSIYDYANDLNTDHAVSTAIGCGILGLATLAVSIPAVGAALGGVSASTSLGIGATGLGTTTFIGVVDALSPGPGHYYLDYLHNVQNGYYNFVISREYAGGSGYGASGQITYAGGGSYSYAR